MADLTLRKKWLQTIQFLAAYLVAAWTFLQFVDWTLNRYNISPYWVDLLLWIFIGIIPSLAIYFFNKERINKRILKRQEKILFPLNILVLMIVTYFGFGNSDLGATTTEIKYTDEAGIPQSKTITKEEFRIGIPIYNFINTKNNDSLNWLRDGIGELLVIDLEQNKSISPYSNFFSKTSDKIKQASLFNSFYIDGEFEKNGDSIKIKVFKRKANNAKILTQETFYGTDLLDMIDEMSFYITEQAGFIETKTIQYLDLPVKEYLSSSEQAVKEFLDWDFDAAIRLDSTFAMAYLAKAKQNYRWNSGQLEVQDITDKAYLYREKLPLQKQLEVNIQRNLAYEDFQSAEAQVKLQLEVDPTNEFYNEVLFGIYGETKNIDAYYEQSELIFNKELNPLTAENMIEAVLLTGQDQFIIEELKSYEIINSNVKVFKLQPLIQLGDFDKAEQELNEIKSLGFSGDNRTKPYDSAISYLKTNGFDKKLLDQFEGKYRATINEQTIELWVDENRIIRNLGHQGLRAFSLAGPSRVIGGTIVNFTTAIDLIKHENEVIGLKLSNYNYRFTSESLFFKEHKSISEAYEAYNSGNYEEARQLCIQALEENPLHAYLQNLIDHIDYIQKTDPEDLITQYEMHSGTYGPRRFYIEDSQFYYKRKGVDTNLPRVQLLALDSSRYMDLTRLGTVMEFETDSSGVLASKGYRYTLNAEGNLAWEDYQSDETTQNYFLKDN